MLDKLKKAFPFPTEHPALGVDFHPSWLDHSNASVLDTFIPKDAKVILEIGSWLGYSASFFAAVRPDATVICVDTWEGSIEHTSDVQYTEVLRKLYPQFIANTWHIQDRIIPIRMRSVNGMYVVYGFNIPVDFVYIDASHEAPDVEADVKTAMDLFPKAVLMGDDARWGGVIKGLENSVVQRGLSYSYYVNQWKLER